MKLQPVTPRSDNLSPRSDAYSPRIYYASGTNNNGPGGLHRTSSTPRSVHSWYFGLSRVNYGWIQSQGRADDTTSDDTQSNASHPNQRSSGPYETQIRQSKPYSDRDSNKGQENRNPNNAKDIKKTKQIRKQDISPYDRMISPDTLPQWREKVLSTKFQKDYYSNLEKLPVKLSTKVASNQKNRYLQQSMSVSTSFVSSISRTLNTQCCQWLFIFLAVCIFVFAASSVPLILYFSQDMTTKYVHCSMQLSLNHDYIEDFNNRSSPAYINLTQSFCTQIDLAYRSSDSEYKEEYVGCTVENVYNGSTTLSFKLCFTKASPVRINDEQVKNILMNRLVDKTPIGTGALGGFNVTVASINILNITYDTKKPMKISSSS